MYSHVFENNKRCSVDCINNQPNQNINMSRYCHGKTPLRLVKGKQHCELCDSRQMCLNAWLDKGLISDIDQLNLARGTYQKGQAIYRLEDHFRAIFIIQSGSVKVEKTLEDGTHHVNGFYFRGDLLGLDSIGNNQYNYDAIALETTRICKIPYAQLEMLSSSIPRLQQKIISLLSSKMHQTNNLLIDNRYLSADKRLLLFLKSLCERDLLQTRGSKSRIYLPMPKTDLASYLGIRAESLSRILANLQKQGVISNRFKYIEINDIDAAMRVICKS
jgi:CRP/FNR family transcriptional regulator